MKRLPKYLTTPEGLVIVTCLADKPLVIPRRRMRLVIVREPRHPRIPFPPVSLDPISIDSLELEAIEVRRPVVDVAGGVRPLRPHGRAARPLRAGRRAARAPALTVDAAGNQLVIASAIRPDSGIVIGRLRGRRIGRGRGSGHRGRADVAREYGGALVTVQIF